MKKITYLLMLTGILFSGVITYAQVGINTETPKADLDIQGTLGIREKIYLGGSETEAGALGQPGTVLVSQGAGNPPVWKMLRRPSLDPNTFYLIDNNAASTQNGIVIGNNISGLDLYTENQTLTSFLSPANSGFEITGLANTFKVNSETNKVAFTFETIAHLNSQGPTNDPSQGMYSGVDFACGIFVNDLLKGVRVYTLDRPDNAGYNFYTYVLFSVADGLEPGEYTAKVACTRRNNVNNFTNTIGIGKAIATNLNDFMTQSSLKIEVFEIPDPENNVPVYVP